MKDAQLARTVLWTAVSRGRDRKRKSDPTALRMSVLLEGHPHGARI